MKLNFLNETIIFLLAGSSIAGIACLAAPTRSNSGLKDKFSLEDKSDSSSPPSNLLRAQVRAIERRKFDDFLRDNGLNYKTMSAHDFNERTFRIDRRQYTWRNFSSRLRNVLRRENIPSAWRAEYHKLHRRRLAALQARIDYRKKKEKNGDSHVQARPSSRKYYEKNDSESDDTEASHTIGSKKTWNDSHSEDEEEGEKKDKAVESTKPWDQHDSNSHRGRPPGSTSQAGKAIPDQSDHHNRGKFSKEVPHRRKRIEVDSSADDTSNRSTSAPSFSSSSSPSKPSESTSSPPSQRPTVGLLAPKNNKAGPNRFFATK